MSAALKAGDKVRVKATARAESGQLRVSAGRAGAVESISSLAAIVRFSSQRGDFAIVLPKDLEAIS